MPMTVTVGGSLPIKIHVNAWGRSFKSFYADYEIVALHLLPRLAIRRSYSRNSVLRRLLDCATGVLTNSL